MSDGGRQAGDHLITGIDWLITVDYERRIIRDGAVAIKDGRFAAVVTCDQSQSLYLLCPPHRNPPYGGLLKPDRSHVTDMGALLCRPN